jgi:hypothetical protein
MLSVFLSGFSATSSAILAVTVLACVAALAGLLIASDRRQRIHDRIEGVLQLHGNPGTVAPTTTMRWYHRLGAMLSNSPLVGRAERDKLADALARAGIRTERAVFVFIAAKFFGLFACWQQPRTHRGTFDLRSERTAVRGPSRLAYT